MSIQMTAKSEEVPYLLYSISQFLENTAEFALLRTIFLPSKRGDLWRRATDE